MQPINIVHRHRTPFERPQAIAFGAGRLWIGSLATRRIYALDPATFAVSTSIEAPGKPWGMTCVGDELRVLCGVGEEDNRWIFRVRDGAFQPDPIPCPKDSGSHLGWDGSHLTVSQWYNRRILLLDGQGAVVREYDASHGIAGHVIVGSNALVLGTDDEAVTPYTISSIDLETRVSTDLAEVPALCRGLAYDGTHFWSNVREAGETIAFNLPG